MMKNLIRRNRSDRGVVIPSTMAHHNNLAVTGENTHLVVSLIEKAIDPYNANSNLELFFEISDLINTREENAREAFRQIRKALDIYKGKNWAVCLKILILLEVCSNNCNKRFQIYLANKDFLSELKHIIGPKLQPPIDIQEKILNLIQHWAAMFKNDSDFKPIESLYSELRSKGVDFPIYNPEMSVTNLTNSLKTTTPQRPAQPASGASGGGVGAVAPAGMHQQQNQMRHARMPDQPPSVGVVKLNEEQIAKLNSELDVVEGNVNVLNEILNELQHGGNSKADEDDLTLLKDLYKTCKEMQKRITQLIGSISNENIINELLRINDDLNGSFLRYERYERGVNFQKNGAAAAAALSSPDSLGSPAGAGAVAVSTVAQAKPDHRISPNQNVASAVGASASKPAGEKSLIDFEDDEFDPLKGKNSQNGGPLSNSNQTSLFSKASKVDKPESIEDPNFDKKMLAEENEIKEMEEWLKQQGLGGENLNPPGDDSVTKK